MPTTVKASVGLALVSLWCFLGVAGPAVAQQGADDRPQVQFVPSDSGTTRATGQDYAKAIPIDLQITNKGPSTWAVLPQFDYPDCNGCIRVSFRPGGGP